MTSLISLANTHCLSLTQCLPGISITMIAQVALFCLISAVAARPPYGAQDYSSPVYEPTLYDEKPQPYTFGFNTKDEYGSTINQEETGDELGNKKGSYGYTDGYGIYRQVDYVADEHGFRATIKTNEPGTDNQNPADVEILSEAAPVAYEKAPVVGAYAQPAANVAPVYAKAAVIDAPVYAQPAPVYTKPVAAVNSPAPVSYRAAPVYDSIPAPAPVYKPAPVNYAPAPVYEPAPVSYGPGPIYDSAPVYGPGSVAAYPSAPVYESVGTPAYGGPSYDQLVDKANQSNGRGSDYEPEAVESYNSY